MTGDSEKIHSKKVIEYNGWNQFKNNILRYSNYVDSAYTLSQTSRQRRYNTPTASLRIGQTLNPTSVLFMKLNCFWLWRSSPGILKNVEFPFITIIHRSTLTRRGSTW